MPGFIVQVFFDKEPKIKGKPSLFRMIETDFSDFADFSSAVEDDDLICGSIIFTSQTDVPGVVRITKRLPIAFRGDAVNRFQMPTWEFVEAVA